MEIEKYKFKINEKVRYMTMIGTIIDAQFHESLGAIYLVRYEDGSEYWAFEDNLENVKK